MAQVIDQIGPAVIVPMHYFGAQRLARFLGLMRDRWEVAMMETPKLALLWERCPGGKSSFCREIEPMTGRAIWRALLCGILRLAYRVELRGHEHLLDLGDRALIVVNHVSFLDAPCCWPSSTRPDLRGQHRDRQALVGEAAQPLSDPFPVDPTNPMAAKAMVKVKEGRPW